MAESLGVAYVEVAAKLTDDFSSALKTQVAAKGGLQKIGLTMGKTLAAGVAASAAAVGAAVVGITKQAFDSYSEYEQLVGGVETLFGAGGKSLEEYAASVGKTVDAASAEFSKLEKAQQIAMSNAAGAYKSAGMSANEYMTNINGIAASLKQSLGGDAVKAAKQADKAIIQMSDNANKMGTDIDSITVAYQGFAKQNYTMLDNLKLGYGGTKSEMERLLADAEKISGVKFDLSSYSDIIDAIQVIQDEMGVTGTTAEEAAETIQGSIAAASSAWQNWLTGLADDNADMDALTENLIESIGTAAENIIPRIGEIVSTLGQTLIDHAPEIGQAAQDLFDQIGEAIGPALPGIAQNIGQLFGQVVVYILAHIPDILNAAVQVFLAIATAVGMAVVEVGNAVGQLFDQCVAWIQGKVGEFTQAGSDLIQGLVNGISAGASWVIDKINSICSDALAAVKSFFGIASPSKVMRRMGGYVSEGLALGIGDGSKDAIKQANKMNDAIAGVFSGGYTSTLSYATAGNVAGFGFYVDGERLATVTAAPRDSVDGKLNVFAERGLDI